MAGLFTLLFGGFLIGGNILDSARADMETNAARSCALRSGKEYYYDGNKQPRWTETNELVYVERFCGTETITGKKTGTVYKFTKSIEMERREKYKEAIDYCKQNNIKYLPWYFLTNITGRDTPGCTGIELDTMKKYCCCRIRDSYWLVYLEENPHESYSEYGTYYEYDALHDGDEKMFKKDMSKYKQERHRGNIVKNDRDYWYYTKAYIITKEEYYERITELEDYPYDFIKERVW